MRILVYQMCNQCNTNQHTSTHLYIYSIYIYWYLHFFFAALGETLRFHQPKKWPKNNLASDTKHKRPPGWSRKLRSSGCWRYPPKPHWNERFGFRLRLSLGRLISVALWLMQFLGVCTVFLKMNFYVRMSWCFQICHVLIYIYIHVYTLFLSTYMTWCTRP